MTRWAPWEVVRLADEAEPFPEADDTHRLTVRLGGLTFHGAKLVAAAGIVVGAFIGPIFMSGYIFIFGALGAYLYYVSLYKMQAARQLAA